ncbi:methyl-CpG-binding domain-containing protein 13 isoform X1 [Pistacia vera]|uniref:methyl-CpG-binding domain-containing protein 13 isoform X1 n=1 Tax=Pistacia vera TaxID=55513 RepID=UPI0012637C4B|nr:methyl-CpG-binding domain-containing protein 13 isoform X1 [Pistacia vera]
MGDMENEVLPDGWRVEMRVRKNGRKDKVYIEKVEAEGLPPGWIKEIRVTKTANKVRKDPVYIDPVSGYFFRSMRDASRYLETGKIGRLAYKPKDKGSNDGGHDEELENDKCDSPTVAKKQKLEVPGAETPVVDQSTTSPAVAKKQKLETPGTKTPVVDWSTKASDIAENEDALNSAGTGEQTENEDALNSDSTGERICLTERASNQNGAGIVLSSSNVPEAKDSNKMDGEKDSDKSASLSTPAVGVLPDRKSSEGGDTGDESKNTGPGKCGSRKKKVLNLPRRASKRLAGVALDPTPELKPITRGRRAVDKQSDEMVASTVEGLAPQVSQQPNELKDEPESNHASDTTKSSDDSLKSGKSWHLTQDSNEHAEKTETDYNSDKKLGCDVVLPQTNQDKAETDSKADVKPGPLLDLPFGTNQDKAETDSKADVKPGPLLDLPFGELLSDPCIAFAIKTLTGATFDTSNTTEVSLGSNNSIFEGFSTSEEHSGKIKTESEGVEKQNNVAIPKEQAVKVKSSYETDENPGLPLDLPFADIWRDPCIEFAIKTLTSSNPVGCDLDIQDYFQQQHNTSQTQASNNFCQTEFLCQQYDVLEKQVSREQGRNGNVRIQSSGEKGLRQHGEKRCNECH